MNTRRCQWCGTENPTENELCRQCGAAFPKPEQDEALLRAAEERMRVANESLEAMRKQRTKRGWWRLFGGR